MKPKRASMATQPDYLNKGLLQADCKKIHAINCRRHEKQQYIASMVEATTIDLISQMHLRLHIHVAAKDELHLSYDA